MTEIEILSYALQQFSDINYDDFKISLPYWKHKTYRKGEFYNEHKSVCRYLGLYYRFSLTLIVEAVL